jgi:hypothetical protein
LFPESENPSRVFVVIVESNSYLGTYEKSPFTFKRQWEVIGGVLDSTQNTLQSENNLLKSSLDDLKSQMSVLVNFIQRQDNHLNNESIEVDSDTEIDKSKRKKGKQTKRSKLAKKTNVEPQAGSSSLLGRIYNSFQGQPSEIDLGEAAMSDIYSENDRASEIGSDGGRLSGPGGDGTSTNYWITNIELELMSSPLDQFNSRGSEDEAMSDYVRLQKSINQYNQVLSCGISYDHFLKGGFIAAFDLTTNQQPGLAYAINTVRTGNKA